MSHCRLANMLSLLSEKLKTGTQITVDALCDETREEYMMSVKKAIIDFVLKSTQDQRDAGWDHMPEELRQASLPWAAQFNVNIVSIESNLHLCSPPMLHLLNLWYPHTP